MWSYVRSKVEPRWLWHAIDHASGTVLAYVFGRRQDTVFVQLKALLEPFGITRFYTDGWGAYERHRKRNKKGAVHPYREYLSVHDTSKGGTVAPRGHQEVRAEQGVVGWGGDVDEPGHG